MLPLKSVGDSEVQDVITGRRRGQSTNASPEAWEDQIIYFFLPDRFSDGNEQGYKDTDGHVVTTGGTPLFDKCDRNNAVGDPGRKSKWLESGMKFVGGNIRAATEKLGYIKRLGATAIWIGPVFKQIAALETYHGYAIQHFLEIDERFGTREDLRDFVRAAHGEGLYVLLDIVLNHSGNVFAYEQEMPMYTGSTFPVKGYWNDQRDGFLPFELVDEAIFPCAYPDCAIWPRELQARGSFFRKGCVRDLLGKPPEITEADFFDLKSLNLGPYKIENFEPGIGLTVLCEVYKYWIAYADIDGYRIDTVRYMGEGPTKFFAASMHEYARSLGKNNFLLLGEIAGDDAYGTVQRTGLDAALGIGNVQKALWSIPQGQANPIDYFGLFATANERTSKASTQRVDAPSRWQRHQIVNMIDDHDQSWRWNMKGRFCREINSNYFIEAAMGLNLCTLGVPCIYYGTEQNFDGCSSDFIDNDHFADRFIREAMFGGEFGAFGSVNRHFFDEGTATYKAIAAIARLRREEIALRRGGQALRAISSDGKHFGIPTLKPGQQRMESVIAWSRIYEETEVLCVISTHLTRETDTFIAIDPELHRDARAGDSMHCIYPPDLDHCLRFTREGEGISISVCGTIPPHSFMVFKA